MPAPELVTPEQLSAYTNRAIAADDPRAQLILDGATRAIRRYCGWHIAGPLTESITLDGPGSSLLQLPTMNVTSIASITENGETVAVDSFEWSALGELRKFGCWWTDRYRSITISLTHGFTDAPDVVQVILQASAAALSSPMGATREQAGQVSISWATTAPGVSGGLSLLQRDLAVLDSYKLPGRL